MHTRLTATILLLSMAATFTHADPVAENGISRALFTSAVRHAEPVDSLSEVNGDQEQVFLFLEARNMTGETVVHTWEHRGTVIASLSFRIDKPLARMWSGRLLTPDMAGSWRVVITNDRGAILAEKTLDYNPADVPF